MRRISRFAAALLVLACALFVASTATADAAKKGKGKVVVTNSQKKIVKKKAIPVTVKNLKRKKVKLTAKSKTFDKPKFKKLAKPKKAKVKTSRKGKPRKVKLMLKLTKTGRKQVKSCEAREIKVRAAAHEAARRAGPTLHR